jgi:hypothetical protein
VLGQLTPKGPRQCALHPGGDAGPGGGDDWRGGHGAEAGQHAGAAGGPILLAGEAASCLSSLRRTRRLLLALSYLVGGTTGGFRGIV